MNWGEIGENWIVCTSLTTEEDAEFGYAEFEQSPAHLRVRISQQ